MFSVFILRHRDQTYTDSLTLTHLHTTTSQASSPDSFKIPPSHQVTSTANTANMPDGYQSFPLPADKRHTNPVLAALATQAKQEKPTATTSDAASTRSSTSFASTISLIKDSFKNKNDTEKKDAKDGKKSGSRPRSERYASTMVNQC